MAVVTTRTVREVAQLPVGAGAAAHRRLRTAVIGAALVAAGCAGDDAPALREVSSAATVADYVGSTCTTGVVIALSRQIAEEVDCLMPGQLVPFEQRDGIVFTGAQVLPYLDSAARDDLYAAAAAHPGRGLRVNSAFRSVAQQYLLRAWFERGRCGITAAATPGQSNHESGRALDIDNWSAWVSDLAAAGWDHTVPGDEVHFDHLASPDIRGADVLAFQRLWNRNHPDDLISEDGDWGPQSEARMRVAPAEGFPIGALCLDADPHIADVVDVTGPPAIAPGERDRFTIRLRNAGTVTWPATTQLVTATGAASALHDAQTWESATEVLTLGEEVAPGAEVELLVEVVGPAVEEVTPLAESLALRDGTVQFGSVTLVITVDPEDDQTSGDALADGCAAAGGAGHGAGLGLGLFALLGLVAARRRRRA